MLRVVGTSKVFKGMSNVFCSKESISPGNCINTKSTGVSYYDDFLDPSQADYLAKQKNLRGYIDQMTPEEYYEACAKVFKCSVQDLKRQREADDKSLDYLTKALESGRKFFLPYVNFSDAGQEGLHRMMVIANKFGWDEHTFPVLVIEHVDSRRNEVDLAKKNLNKALRASLEYKFFEDCLPEDLVDQIQWELNNLDPDGESGYTAKCLGETDECFYFTLVGFESEISIEVIKETDIHYKSSDDFNLDDDDLDIDLDDLESKGIDINDIDAVLRYLG